ncbi:MAG TPA: carboxypeptidase-like regulatory domain-containing protein, partial [Pyrinomonadaceae bacterium]
MKRSLRWRLPAIILCALASAAVCFGQESRATLTGTVNDPNGAAVQNATVTATNQQTGLSTTANTTGEGNYTITPLIPGRYTVAVEAQGF